MEFTQTNVYCKANCDCRAGVNKPKLDNFVVNKQLNYSEIPDSLFLFCAGPLGNMMSHQLWEHNKENTYIDIGSTLDIHLGIGATRGYLGGGNNRVCNWG